METTELGDHLADKTENLAMRIRCLYELRARGGEEAVTQLARALDDSSALLKHEIAYTMGQIRKTCALPHLFALLDDPNEDLMVRHEAAEAMGAIGSPESLEILRKYEAREDEPREIRETCELSIERIEWEQKHPQHHQHFNEGQEDNEFYSVDPAPAEEKDKEVPVAELRARLLDRSLPLFMRYKAMFSLRNKGTEEAVLALCDGFEDDSALFRHEIAFVLGQLANSVSAETLRKVLERPDEHYMVRHEAAEALGSIASDDMLGVLQAHTADAARPVSESCVVALDMHEYWSKWNRVIPDEDEEEVAAAEAK